MRDGVLRHDVLFLKGMNKMRTLCGTILASAISMSVSASPLSENPARTTPDWFRKGVMYQIQPRAFTPEGTIKAATAKLDWLADMGVSVVYMCPVTVADDDPRQDMWSPRQVKSGFGNPRNPRLKDFLSKVLI